MMVVKTCVCEPLSMLKQDGLCKPPDNLLHVSLSSLTMHFHCIIRGLLFCFPLHNDVHHSSLQLFLTFLMTNASQPTSPAPNDIQTQALFKQLSTLSLSLSLSRSTILHTSISPPYTAPSNLPCYSAFVANVSLRLIMLLPTHAAYTFPYRFAHIPFLVRLAAH